MINKPKTYCFGIDCKVFHSSSAWSLFSTIISTINKPKISILFQIIRWFQLFWQGMYDILFDSETIFLACWSNLWSC